MKYDLVLLRVACSDQVDVFSLSLQTKKFADVIIPRGADNSGLLCCVLPITVTLFIINHVP